MLFSLYVDCIVANGLFGFDMVSLVDLVLGGIVSLIVGAYGTLVTDALERVVVQGVFYGNMGVVAALVVGIDLVVHVDVIGGEAFVFSVTSVFLMFDGKGFNFSDF